ncbi:quinoprotein relay system zinc metallohydrolase 2 [Derxia gummosa]|uniref:Quinoprotein relay system zinc metallohydrolase 2 n=1 Tax=Derxia gummosa DSM 723 TaxID=1121388 RepID=A0A8B6XCE7_9BURK|nr:quinoprotein relay system zinc metallohydrolase 2 [Derxia gummosa]
MRCASWPRAERRRQWLPRLALFAAALVAGLMVGARAASQDEARPARFELKPIAPGVFVHEGRQEESAAANRGDIANLGLVVGRRCAAAIDSGGSLAVGRDFVAAIRRVTDLPVCVLINTHAHPDHVLGNAAFAEAWPTLDIVGHARLPAALAARGPAYLHALARDLGPVAEGSRIVTPTVTVVDRGRIDLGGRTLALRAWPTAHTDCDLSVRDEPSDTLFTGDLLFVERIPALDGSLDGWLGVLAALREPVPAHVVPGHGAVDAPWRAALDREAGYLGLLRDEAGAALDAGRGLGATLAAELPEAARQWRLAPLYHRRNLTAAYAELEWSR